MNSQKVILLVEDNQQDELLTIRALKKHGIHHDIIVCRDGSEALDWLFSMGRYVARDKSIVPTVIILDLKLPKMNGHEVLSIIRSSPLTKNLPVVILTTSKEVSDIAKSYDEGANSYVQKPVNFDEFSEAVKNLGVYWLVLNEPPNKQKFAGEARS